MTGPLDPIDTNIPASFKAGIFGLPPGASGKWTGGRGAVDAPRSSRRWVPGWDRDERCPADPKGECSPGSEGWRELGAAAGPEWREVHGKRRQAVRLLRRAGYVVRWRWPRERTGVRLHGTHAVDRWTYTGGPAHGLEAVDPWKAAARLSACGAAWYAQARVTAAGALRVIALPRPCGMAHVCPACASWRSWTLATAARTVLSSTGPALALVTLTHRDAIGRTLRDEVERLTGALRAMTQGRAGMEWRAHVSGWLWGLETTYNAQRASWHVHAHVIVEHAGPAAEVARWIGQRWRDVTRRAAMDAGLTVDDGWLPGAGGVWAEHTDDGWIPDRRPGWKRGDAEWWRAIPRGDPAAIYQACKYPTPVVDLDPVRLAEFLAVAHGRRWHDAGGTWRGIRRQAEAMDMGNASAEELAAVYDVGRNVSRCGPREAPALDGITPGLGVARCRCGASGEHEGCYRDRPASTRWTLARGAPVDLVTAAVTAAGGEVHGGRIWVPRGEAARLLREWASARRAPPRHSDDDGAGAGVD